MRVIDIIEDINKKEKGIKYITSRNCFMFVNKVLVYGSSFLTNGN